MLRPRVGRLAAWALAASLASAPCAHAVSYTCTPGEVVGEVQGETGSVCAPRCRNGGNFDCPLDVPPGTTAQPQCMLQDVSQVPYCGLLCQVDMQCPSGATCKRVGMPEVGVCIHPLSFWEWASGQGNRQKLAVGWPAKAGQSAKGFQIARAYAALQSLKRRYGVADGDADVLTVKELLSAASVSAGGAAAANPSAPAAVAATPVQAAATAPTGNRVPSADMSLDAFRHDVNYFANNLQSGLPGLEREVHDTIWNIEHITERHVASELLRSVLLLMAVYLGGGAAYKYHTLGARGMDMIPHVGFWMEYPSLVADGVRYATGVVTEMLGGRPMSRGGLSGGGLHSGDRDTFAHFEPSK